MVGVTEDGATRRWQESSVSGRLGLIDLEWYDEGKGVNEVSERRMFVRKAVKNTSECC